MNARRLLASACSVGALLALTGCEKPAPIVTVLSNGHSVYAEANRWCFEGQTWPDCAERHEGATTIEVSPGGGTIGVDVDKELADTGWFVQVAEAGQEQDGGQPTEVQEGHYATFSFGEVRRELLLTVYAVGEGDEPAGEWTFRLRPER